MSTTKAAPKNEMQKETYASGIKAGEAAVMKWKREAESDESKIQRFVTTMEALGINLYEPDSHEEIQIRVKSAAQRGVGEWLFRALTNVEGGEFERHDVFFFWEEAIGIGGAKLIEDDDFAQGFYWGVLYRM